MTNSVVSTNNTDTTEDDIDSDARNNLSTTEIKNPLDYLPTNSTMETLQETPGSGLPFKLQDFPTPKLPKTRGRKPGVVGHPPHEPTQEMRQFVLNMRGSGWALLTISNRLRINVKTLSKYYHYELELAESIKDDIMDGATMLDALRASADPKNFAWARKLYYNRHNKIVSQTQAQVDVTSGGQPLAPPLLIVGAQSTEEHISAIDRLNALKDRPLRNPRLDTVEGEIITDSTDNTDTTD